MVQTILAKLTAMVQRAPRIERRASKRHEPQQMTPCQMTSSNGVRGDTALVHDLSLHGAGILSIEGFEAGTIIQLLLINASHTCALNVEFEIVRCTRSPAGTFFLGGRFVRTLSHDEIVPFLI